MPGVMDFLPSPSSHKKFPHEVAKENVRVKPLLGSVTPGAKKLSSNRNGSPSSISKKDHLASTNRSNFLVKLAKMDKQQDKPTPFTSKSFYENSVSGGKLTRPHDQDTTEKLHQLQGITVTLCTKTPKKDTQDARPLSLNGQKSSRSYSSDWTDEDQQKAKKFKNHHIKEPHLIGFKNQGATCYINSVLQVLTGLENFCSEVLDELPLMSSQLCPLQSLLQARRDGKDDLVYPCLMEIHTRFAEEVDHLFKSPCDQQDMDEFLMRYLDKIDSQIKQKRKELQFLESSPTLVEKNFFFKYTETRICKKCQDEKSSSEITNTVRVMMAQEDVFTSHNQRKSVQQLVQSTLEGPWDDCHICQESNAVKTFKKFNSLPRTLFVVLSRYNKYIQKLETPVDISPYLDLKNFVSSDCWAPAYCSTANRPIAPGFESVAIQTDPDLLEIENPDTPETDNEDTSLKEALNASLQDQWRDNREEEDMKRAMQESIAEMDPFAHKPASDIVYRLSAVVNHYGHSANSGHYKSDVFRKEKNRWYTYDDLNVEAKSSVDVLSGGEEVCYLLVYEFDGQYDAFKPQYKDAQEMTCTEHENSGRETTPEKHLEDAREFELASSFFKKEENEEL